jgi:hypothetical protein
MPGVGLDVVRLDFFVDAGLPLGNPLASDGDHVPLARRDDAQPGAGRGQLVNRGPLVSVGVVHLGGVEVLDAVDDAVDPAVEDLKGALIEANGGNRVDVVLEMSGGRVFEQSAEALAPFGRLVTYGITSAVPHMMSKMGYGTFLFFGCATWFGIVVFFFILPDLKGRSLESMDDLFERPLPTMWKHAYPTEEEKVFHVANEMLHKDEGEKEDAYTAVNVEHRNEDKV